MKTVCLSLAFTALASATQVSDSPAAGKAKEGAKVDQIETAEKTANKAKIEAIAVGKDEKRKTSTAIGQLPEDAEAPDDGLGPESNIGLDEGGPESRLYGQVAEVWTTIRKRGLQPSPELIAREIGPDTLAQFLDKYPGASDMFGKDQDSLPVDPSSGVSVPEGGATVTYSSPASN